MSSKLLFRDNRTIGEQTAKTKGYSREVELVRGMIDDNGIHNGIRPEDIYNFDETGFAMGLIATTKVVTRPNATVGGQFYSQGLRIGRNHRMCEFNGLRAPTNLKTATYASRTRSSPCGPNPQRGSGSHRPRPGTYYPIGTWTHRGRRERKSRPGGKASG